MTERYPLIYADFAWSYNDRGHKHGGASDHYSTMSLVDVAHTLDRFAAKDCTAFIWMTWATEAAAIEAMHLAGFRKRTLGFIWVKTTKNGKYHFGTGRWTRANTEPCYIFTRGAQYPRRQSASVSQLIFAPVGEHSAKPDETRDRIVELMGDHHRRIELCARKRVPGWGAWGNEVDERLPKPAPRRRKETTS